MPVAARLLGGGRAVRNISLDDRLCAAVLGARHDRLDIEGGHLASATTVFVMIALGEALLATVRVRLSQSPHLDAPKLIALSSRFAGSVAMWWIYFDTSSRHGTEATSAPTTRSASARTSTTFT